MNTDWNQLLEQRREPDLRGERHVSGAEGASRQAMHASGLERSDSLEERREPDLRGERHVSGAEGASREAMHASGLERSDK